VLYSNLGGVDGVWAKVLVVVARRMNSEALPIAGYEPLG
jgi:hypothetical protein